MKNITIKLASIAMASLMSLSAMTSIAADASAQWVETDGKYTYTDDETGKTLTGWQDIDGSRYYLGKNGVRRTGWVKINGKTYYFGKNGKMRTGKRKIGSKVYDFGKDGVMKDEQSAVKYSASEVLSLMKKDLGSSYTCDNVCGKDEVANFFGLDTSKLESYVYENDSISAIHMNTALILKTKEGYADTAAKLIQKSFDSFGSYAISYGYDAARTKQARLFVQGNYVGFFILGEETDDDKTAETEAKKIDEAWAKIFGTTPENIVKIPEAFDIEDGMLGDGLEG